MSEWEKVTFNEDGDADPFTRWEPEYKNVLNAGFVGLVDFMGDDSAVINAARVSYGRGTKATRSDEGLIRYLMRHWHSTPFEMVEFKFHVKAPIFVFRQWHRHRTASINEYSGRYSVMEDDFFIPHHSTVAAQSSDNKQGRTTDLISPEDYNAVRAALESVYQTAYDGYRYLLGPNEEGHQSPAPAGLDDMRLKIEAAALESIRTIRNGDEAKVWTEDEVEVVIRDWLVHAGVHTVTPEFPGIAREMARVLLPLSTYSQMYWKMDLKNLMDFIRLRSDLHAQYEIRAYSDAMVDLITPLVPMSMRAFRDYRMEAVNLSRMEKEMVALARRGQIDITNDEAVSAYLTSAGCSGREIREFLQRF